MFSKTWLINIFLAGIAVFFGINAHDVWLGGEDASLETRAVPKSGPAPRPGKRVVNQRMPSESAYRVVADRNLFAPDRAEFIPEEPEPEPESEIQKVRISGKEISLYGVILMDNYKSALVNNPLQEMNEREYQWVKMGDAIGELEVTDIQKERILLADKDKKYEVPLYDKEKSGKGKNIRRTGKRAGKASKPTVVVSGSEKGAKTQTSEKRKTSDSGYETINTPFGKMKRKKKGSVSSENRESLKDMGVPTFNFFKKKD